MNALTFKHLMCRNNDELVTRQKLLKRKIMRRLLALSLGLQLHCYDIAMAQTHSAGNLL